MKKIFKFLMFLLPWFLSILIFRIDYEYYNALKLPNFALKPWLIFIIWTIMYILLAVVAYKIYNMDVKKEKLKAFRSILIINYIFNQLFNFGFFIVKSSFLGFFIAFSNFISSFWLFYETYNTDRKLSRLLIPYVIWCLFTSLLALTIFLTNY